MFQKPVAAVHSSRCHSTFLLLVGAYGNVSCCVCFLKMQIWLAENAKNCKCLWFVLLIKSNFFKTTCWISHIEVFFSDCAIVELHSINKFLRKRFVHSEFWGPKKNWNCKSFRFSLRIKPFLLQNSWLHFVHQSKFFTGEELLDCQTTHLIPCNGNLMSQTSQKLSNSQIRLDIQTRFCSEQLSGYFFRPAFNQKFCFCTRLLSIHIFFLHPFSENLMGLTCQSLCICMMHLCIRIFSRAAGCVFSSRHLSAGFNFWMVLKWEALSFVARSGNSVTWELQNWHMYVVFVKIPAHLLKYRLDFFHQCLSGQFHLCIRLLDKHIPKHFSCIRNLIGWNWQKCNL